ncbi:MAG TPA: erythronate-4-phosphate dehydrogenase [Spirochaetia bacterium]|nr:erythronate-4-phosphate dehydrogenase [Spirochaetia bacterium]
MIIYADENIPFAGEAFSTIGETILFPGRSPDPKIIKKTDLLIIRSITKTGAALLAGSPVKFVGTATIGTDHVDIEYLDKHGIAFTSAPGCNSNSVSEYITAAVVKYLLEENYRPENTVIGIIGCGNVGSKVELKMRALGLKVLVYDPPLAEKSAQYNFSSLLEITGKADIITLHVPLTKSPPYPTFRLADHAFFSSFAKPILFINSSRGQVTNEKALRSALAAGQVKKAVLDVWDNEPAISRETMLAAWLGTPHIAGYSMNGKINGTEMIYQAACRYLETKPVWKPDLSKLQTERMVNYHREKSFLYNLDQIITAGYKLSADHELLYKTCDLSPAERGKHFDLLRKNYPQRWEFQHTKVTGDFTPAEMQIIRQLGFHAA